MLDHALGRPDARYRKYQILGVVFAWALYLRKGDRHGPKILRPLSKLLGRHLTVWHVVVITGLHYYVIRNLSTVVGLQYPEPLANMYSKEYFIATWITTALDAGFWTAMDFRPKWIRDISSIVFSLYFLVAADQADEMVRRVRGGLTKEHLRVSWNKPRTPYIAFLNRILRPRHLTMTYRPRRFMIDRPAGSAYTERINAWLYFDGPTAQLKDHDKIILDIPGGGFVAMDPRCHDDKLMAWAVKTGLPIVAVDYKKAPEHPYPYALNECYDAYYQITATRGQNVGLSGASMPKIVISGDSAGGNLAAALVLMILDSSSNGSSFFGVRSSQPRMPPPVAVLLIYPALDVNITSWMNDEQIALMHQRKRRHINKGVIDQKRSQYRSLATSPYASDDEGQEDQSLSMRSNGRKPGPPLDNGPLSPTLERLSAVTSTLNSAEPSAPSPPPIKSRLYMRSMIAYFNDRVLSPEMLRGMIMMYVGEHNRPDFDTDYLLSPIKAPEQLLAQFPKTYMLTGERDPLIDDTVLFAGRLRQAKLQLFHERKELGLVRESEQFDDADHVETYLVPRVSHGFLQFAGVYRRGWDYIELCSRWMKEALQRADDCESALDAVTPSSERGNEDPLARHPRTRRRSQAESSDGEDRPLEMSALRMTPMAGSSGAPTAAGEAASGRTRTERKAASGRGSIRKAPAFSGRKSPALLRQSRSLQRLSSAEDLMGRRMNELAEGLRTRDPDPS